MKQMLINQRKLLKVGFFVRREEDSGMKEVLVDTFRELKRPSNTIWYMVQYKQVRTGKMITMDGDLGLD